MSNERTLVIVNDEPVVTFNVSSESDAFRLEELSWWQSSTGVMKLEELVWWQRALIKLVEQMEYLSDKLERLGSWANGKLDLQKEKVISERK